MAGRTHETALTIGKLCFGGDWACAHGDPSGLRYVAQRLAVSSQEPLHCELLALADVCYSDPDRAAVLWTQLRDKLPRS
jgi:hypothetical protein